VVLFPSSRACCFAESSRFFPSAREVVVVASLLYPRWLAFGAGSVINLTNMTNLVVAPGQSLGVWAPGGGRVDLRGLQASDGLLNVSAENANSLIDLSGLSGRWSPGADSPTPCNLSASDGGTIRIPNITSLDRVDVYLYQDASINIAQLRSYTEGTLSLRSRTNGFSSLTNFSGSISLYDSRLDWTQFTTLSASNRSVYLSANQGSVLDLSHVTNVILGPFFLVDVSAAEGSRIHSTALRQPEGTFIGRSHNPGSVVDLSAFRGQWNGVGGAVTASDGGAVLIPNVTAMHRVSLQLHGDASVPTGQLRSHTGADITLHSRTNGFAGLTNFTGAFYLTDARLDLTNFSVFHATNESIYIYASQGIREVAGLSLVGCR
jgi:hypothetical protein